MGIDLPLIWLLIIGFGIMMYVIADGFDLGIGILFPFIKDRSHRDAMVNTVAPVWDGNETWLVFGGAGLMAAFPKAYAILLSAFYVPAILMLVGLILRGVSFEFRFKADDAHKPFWDRAFMIGSFVATFFQGVMLGALIEGVPVVDGNSAYGLMDWLTPFSIFTGIGVVVGYALLGVTWLVLKTEGDLQRQMIRVAKPITLAVLAAIIIASIWTPLANDAIANRWFSHPNFWFFTPVPMLVVIATYAILRTVRNDPHAGPFVWSLVLVFLAYTGFVISIWPNIVPPSLSIWDAAGPPESMGFTLVGALLIIPMIIGYSAWAYYVFRGKVKVGEGYH
ncbi:cytochrome d ubiquinol oxidase subunit II [Paraburkholderia hospita]|uniref:Cytochrome d ubiquinol oxidase subunit II n=1 Tax=Paraburkholderia hospita TaxID=169430 RepID=A0ABP2PXF9_9BURK|nr:cytochrome d ubiquinol oxidase subunit II [Paraburkholderia hospita]EIN02185.1 cytochrome d ubiquinol oxidase subunit II [Paraburkholderia hospita]OUL90146.1 cytochrome d ubiquinol oxidase subunit II [Paraburkholderia hospita]